MSDASALHDRVLFVPSADAVDLVVIAFGDPGTPQALHRALRSRIEGSLLAELARTADDLREQPSRIGTVRFVAFAEISDIVPAVRAFGLRPAEPSDARWRSALARARGEARAAERTVPDEPASAWEAIVAPPSASVRSLEDRLLAITRDVFGREPGAPFERLRRAFGEVGAATALPSLEGLDALERAIVPRDPSVIRWIPPLVFQALADGIGVLASSALGRRVGWAECDPDDDGVVPPPMLRVEVDGGHAHVPIGLELLRFAVMPRVPGEEIPPLSRFVEALFSGGS